MKVDYDLCVRLAKASFNALGQELVKELGGADKGFKTNTTELMGMYLTVINIFVEYMVNTMNMNTKIPHKVAYNEVVDALTYCFLREDHALH